MTGDLRVGDQAKSGQHQVEALAGLVLRTLGPAERQLIERAALQQECAEHVDEVVRARIQGATRLRRNLTGHRPPSLVTTK